MSAPPEPASGAPPPLREVIARHGLSARRSLGQHFLLDMNLTRRIARAAELPAGASAIEIGPGPGGLTRALLETPAARVVAVERDARAVAALAELVALYPGRLSVVPGDALETDIAALAPAPRHIVANLPYNIATALLVRWLALGQAVASMTLMFQKEVALRLVAPPGGADYGRLSVLTQWSAEASLLFDVGRKAFVPPPKVTSTVVRIVPRAAPAHPCRRATLERVTQAAFGQRRKMLRQSLKALGDPLALLAAAHIDPTARAEEIDVAGFAALARALDGRP